ncbi:MAG: class I SAM-dependent methyltransferase [Deltaproteobacteria bacterium]|nr:class I SAM-dependent methyltransferase [Deltaproteobacteria bacterium]
MHAPLPPQNPQPQTGQSQAEFVRPVVTSFGIRADAGIFNAVRPIEPPISETGKAFVTLNRFGFDTIQFDPTWVTEGLLNLASPGSSGLDIGAGYGRFTIAALQRGATMICNDLSMDQMLWTRSQVSPHLHEKLFLNTSAFPNLTLEKDSLDFISAHRVLHFLEGNTIENGLQRCYRWLKPGGTLGIVVMSASHSLLREHFLPIYSERVEKGSRWPGEGVDTKRYLPAQAYALPEKLHVLDPEQLEIAVRAAGFHVQRCDWVSLAKFGIQSDRRDGREASGILATKESA